MSPKPVYEQLKRLIHGEWQTRVSGATDAFGRFAFRGFGETYRPVIQMPAGAAEKTLHLKTSDNQELTITLAPDR